MCITYQDGFKIVSEWKTQDWDIYEQSTKYSSRFWDYEAPGASSVVFKTKVVIVLDTKS